MIRRAVLLLLCSVLTAACDEVVATEHLRTTVEERDVSCTHFAFCFTCMPGLVEFGKAGQCGFKFSPICPGVQRAEVNVTPVLITRESGRVSRREEIRVRSFIGNCH